MITIVISEQKKATEAPNGPKLFIRAKPIKVCTINPIAKPILHSLYLPAAKSNDKRSNCKNIGIIEKLRNFNTAVAFPYSLVYMILIIGSDKARIEIVSIPATNTNDLLNIFRIFLPKAKSETAKRRDVSGITLKRNVWGINLNTTTSLRAEL